MIKAGKYTNEAIEINMQLKAWRGVAINYELLSRCDFNQKQYPDAKNDLNNGMPYALLANESYIFSQYYLGYAKLQAVENNHTILQNIILRRQWTRQCYKEISGMNSRFISQKPNI